MKRFEVFYDPADPTDCRIDSTFSLWGGSMILGGVGLVFGGIGGGIFLAGRLAARRRDDLRRCGKAVVTRFRAWNET